MILNRSSLFATVPNGANHAGAPPSETSCLLFHQLDFAKAPFFREEGYKRAIEAQDCEPTLAGHGLYPVAALNAVRLGRAEPDCRGAVRIGFGGWRRIVLASGTRVELWRLEHRSRLIVVDRERPERRRRNMRRQCHLIGLGSVEAVLVRIQKTHQIL